MALLNTEQPAALATVAGLSGPVGAFAAGVYIGKTDAFHWLGTALKPFKIFLQGYFS